MACPWIVRLQFLNFAGCCFCRFSAAFESFACTRPKEANRKQTQMITGVFLYTLTSLGVRFSVLVILVESIAIPLLAGVVVPCLQDACLSFVQASFVSSSQQYQHSAFRLHGFRQRRCEPAVFFLGSYLSRTGPRSVLDKYDPEKSRRNSK